MVGWRYAFGVGLLSGAALAGCLDDETVDAGSDAGSDAGFDAEVTAPVDVPIDHPLGMDVPPPDAGSAPDAPDVPPAVDAPDVAPSDTPDVPPTVDVPPPVPAAPRPVAPLTGAHAPTPRPTLRWALPTGVTGARVVLCRDRALAAGCVTFDATGTAGSPAADLAPGVWYWGLRRLDGAAAGSATSPVWRLRVGAATAAGARPWGGDPDVNGDGLADVIDVVYTETGTELRVSLGTPGGVRPSTAYAAPLDSTGFGIGFAFGFAGDVDGDGYGDAIVGAPRSETAYVYRGGPSGLVASPITLTGPRGSGFGTSVLGPGDLNGDSFADVVITAPSGNLVVVPGSAAGPGAPLRYATGVSRVAAAGDLDLDGRADLVVDNAVVFGSATGIDFAGRRVLTVQGGPAGDMDGDGAADLAVVVGGSLVVRRGAAAWPGPDVALGASATVGLPLAPSADFNGDGRDDLNFDSSFILAPSPLGPAAYLPRESTFGGSSWSSARSTGDVDGDGRDDLVSGVDAGAHYLQFASPSGFPPGAAFRGSPSTGPEAIAGAGDVNRDGRADLLTVDVAGDYRLFLGTADGFAATAAATVRVPGGAFGQLASPAAAGVGDVNGDGYGDVLLNDPNGSRGGRLYLGTATGLAATFTALPYMDRGARVALRAAGDVNGDDRADVVVGVTPSPLVFFGTATGVDPTPRPLSSTYAAPPATLASAGDLNRDGFDDLLVQAAAGAPAVVFAGSATGLLATPLATFAPPGPDVRAAAPGDVNCDGIPDVVLAFGGDLHVYHGSAAGFGSHAPSILRLLRGAPFAVGDVNGDRCADLLVSRSEFSQILFGGAPSLGPGLAGDVTAATPNVPGPAGFGDVDGDGRADVVTFTSGVIGLHLSGRIARPAVVLSTPWR